MHPDSSKKDVAKAILQGFQRAAGYLSDLPVATWKQMAAQAAQVQAQFAGVMARGRRLLRWLAVRSSW